MKPITRIDYYLATITNDEDAVTPLPDPVTRIDHYLAALAGVTAEIPEIPFTRIDHYLAAINGKSVELPAPITRIDKYLAAIAGQDIDPLPAPITRIDHYLASWAEISSNWTWEKIVRQLAAGKTIPNGVEFVVHHDVYGDMPFITRRCNVDKVHGSPNTPTCTIQSKYLISNNGGTSSHNLQYDRPEAFIAPLETAIPANSKVKFSLNIAYGSWTVGSYQFTPTAQLPVGAVLTMSGYQNTALTGLKVQAWTDRTGVTKIGEWAVSASDGTEDVDLGNWQNHPQRVSYGSNNEAESNLFQFLNGIGTMRSIWEPQTPYDMMTTNWNATTQGFLGGFPEEFRACLGYADIDNITNNVFEVPPVEKNKKITHQGYIWLASRKEIYGTDENTNESGETQFPYYAETGTTDADKLMYAEKATSPTSYWLRTPTAGYAYYVRFCYTGNGGALVDGYAYSSLGLAPLAILVPAGT